MNTTANANLFSRLFEGLDDPRRLAIETHDGERITYGDLIARAGQVANVLVERGVKVGDRVLFGKWSGTEMKRNGEDLMIMKEADLLAVIDRSTVDQKAA